VQRTRPLFTQTISVLRAPAADPARWLSTRDVSAEANPGSLYPIPGRPTEGPTRDNAGNRLPAVPDAARWIRADLAERNGRSHAAAR